VSCMGACELRFAARPASILELSASAERLSRMLEFGGKSSDVKGLSESDVPAYDPRSESSVGAVVVNLEDDTCCIVGAYTWRSNTDQAAACWNANRIREGEGVSVKRRGGQGVGGWVSGRAGVWVSGRVGEGEKGETNPSPCHPYRSRRQYNTRTSNQSLAHPHTLPRAAEARPTDAPRAQLANSVRGRRAGGSNVEAPVLVCASARPARRAGRRRPCQRLESFRGRGPRCPRSPSRAGHACPPPGGDHPHSHAARRRPAPRSVVPSCARRAVCAGSSHPRRASCRPLPLWARGTSSCR
jgi:hypothetical protein